MVKPQWSSASESQVEDAAKKLSAYFVTKEEYSNLAQAVLDQRTAPSIIYNRGSRWVVRSKGTGQAREMQYSLGRLLNVLRHRASNTMPERNCGAELEFVNKAISDSSSGNGGSLIPQEWTDFIIPELGARTVVLASEPTILPMAHDVLNIPSLTGGATWSWVAENTGITPSNPPTSTVTLTLQAGKMLTQVSIEWMRDATPETDAALQANLVRTAARGVDNGFLNGTGHSSGQPLGLSQVSGIQTAGAGNGAANGALATFNDISGLKTLIESANVSENNLHFFMNPHVWGGVRQLTDSIGRPLFLPSPNGPDVREIFGIPVSLSTQIPQNLTVGSSSATSYILLVAMDDMYVGEGVKSRGLELAISNDAYFTSASVAIRLMYRTDIQPGHPVSIAMLTGCL